MGEIYVSVDIEADGPIPADNSMLNLGAAAFDLSGKSPLVPIATFEVNIEPALGATQDPDTMGFWARNPEAWAQIQKNPVPPDRAMEDFYAWTRALPGKPVLVVYPTYDFMWVRYYTVKHLGVQRAKLFGFAALDIKTLAMGHLGTTFKNTAKRRMPKHWFHGSPKHDHTGLADAISQGVLFVNLMKDIRGK